MPIVREIGVLLFDGFSLITASIIPEIFGLANEIYSFRNRGGKLYNVSFISEKGARVHCSSSISVWTQSCSFCDTRGFDALFVADGPGAERALLNDGIMTWLAEMVPLSAVIAPIGKGRLLLDAATGSRHARLQLEEMARQHNVATRPNILYEAADRVEPTRSALMVVRRDLGAEAAREIGTRISLGGGNALSSLLPGPQAEAATEKIRAAAQWLRQNCERSISVSDAVGLASMSERNFLRCFKREIGVTPYEYLIQARLELTSRLLVETTMSIDSIAKRCGWINGDRLSKVFRRRFASTPSEFREQAASQKVIRGGVTVDSGIDST
jgi:transcriptional regulator GlxA family with amidase domain